MNQSIIQVVTISLQISEKVKMDISSGFSFHEARLKTSDDDDGSDVFALAKDGNIFQFPDGQVYFTKELNSGPQYVHLNFGVGAEYNIWWLQLDSLQKSGAVSLIVGDFENNVQFREIDKNLTTFGAGYDIGIGEAPESALKDPEGFVRKYLRFHDSGGHFFWSPLKPREFLPGRRYKKN